MTENNDLSPEKMLQKILQEIEEINKHLRHKTLGLGLTEDWITEGEASLMLRKGKTSLYYLREEGKIKATTGRPIFYSRKSILKYLDSLSE